MGVRVARWHVKVSHEKWNARLSVCSQHLKWVCNDASLTLQHRMEIPAHIATGCEICRNESHRNRPAPAEGAEASDQAFLPKARDSSPT